MFAGILAATVAWWFASGTGKPAADQTFNNVEDFSVPLKAESHQVAPPTLPRPIPAAATAPPQPPFRGDERVVLHTIAGDLVLAMYPEAAPNTVRQFLRLVWLRAYDGAHFGGLVPGFYLQVSNAPEDRLIPTSDNLETALMPIRSEVNTTRHCRGVLSLPPGNGPDTSALAFSIILGEVPHLDGGQTAFGHVEAGLDVLERLEKVPCYAGNHPSVRLTILQAEVMAREAVPALVLEGPRPMAAILSGEPPPSLAVRGLALLQTCCWHVMAATNAKAASICALRPACSMAASMAGWFTAAMGHKVRCVFGLSPKIAPSCRPRALA